MSQEFLKTLDKLFSDFQTMEQTLYKLRDNVLHYDEEVEKLKTERDSLKKKIEAMFNNKTVVIINK